jgi:transposase
MRIVLAVVLFSAGAALAWEGSPLELSTTPGKTEVLLHCIGVDVSKQELVTYDGRERHTFPNEPGLRKFANFIKKTGEVVIIYEPTSTYSHRLEAFCGESGPPCCAVNLRITPHLREVARGRSKTDKSDADLL